MPPLMRSSMSMFVHRRIEWSSYQHRVRDMSGLRATGSGTAGVMCGSTVTGCVHVVANIGCPRTGKNTADAGTSKTDIGSVEPRLSARCVDTFCRFPTSGNNSRRAARLVRARRKRPFRRTVCHPSATQKQRQGSCLSTEVGPGRLRYVQLHAGAHTKMSSIACNSQVARQLHVDNANSCAQSSRPVER